jgi:phage FluMu protein Com
MTEIELRCKSCTRFLGIKGVETLIAQVRCPSSKCKELNNIKVVNSQSSPEQLRYKFKENKT